MHTIQQPADFPEKAEDSPLDKFNSYFLVVAARSDAEIKLAQQIRYQVYCIENAFEDAAGFPDGIEFDEFDSHSVHSLLIHRASGRAVGTTRLILPIQGALDRSFAIQRVCTDPGLKRLPLQRTAEVSRFSISKQFRRREGDTQYEGRSEARGRRSIAPLMSLGLIQSLVRMSFEHGITHWCATMEPTLLRLLVPMGIHFERLGPVINFHGTRQPCYCVVSSMLERVKREQKPFWDVLTDGGVLEQRPPLAA